MTQRIRKCYSIDEQDAGRISRLSSEMGLPESNVLDGLLKIGLSDKPELTAVERYHYQREVIIKALDSILLTFSIIRHEGSLSDKTLMCFICVHGFARQKNSEFRNGIIETSIFEVLEKIRSMDKNLHSKITLKMSPYGRLRERYASIYEKKV